MGRGEFEEIFEECLTALLEGRRTIEDSLFLYPAWRGRLEPLLRAAEDIAASYDQSPPPFARERGRERFLEAARSRRRLREILPPQARSTPWWRWAPVGLAATAVLGVLAVMSTTMMADGGSGGEQMISIRPFEPTPPPGLATAIDPTPSPLEKVQTQVAVLDEIVREGKPVDVQVLENFQAASAELAESLDSPEQMELIDRMAAVSAANNGYELLQRLEVEYSGLEALVLRATLIKAGGILEKLGAPKPTPLPTQEPTPIVTPTPSPTPTGTPSEPDSSTPIATPEAEE